VAIRTPRILRITERYQRVDHDTILYTLTVVDPMAYTKPIEGATSP